MSRKYDFGYELKEGTTNKWAFDQISENSVVLELGAAVGNLTKHLKENKNCTIDIVEIDTESGAMAERFARNALLGEQDGNLNADIWQQKLLAGSYDYVVILDVLEHLDDPHKVLSFVKKLLKDSGKIIASIPNIANNAVMVNLFNDKFEYTELGLLDRTHRYFMTYNTILQMTEKLGLNIDSIDAILREVGTSEIANSYEDVPEEVEYFFKRRKLGNVYQYLLVLGKEKISTKNGLEALEKSEETYETLVLFNGLSDKMLKFQSRGQEINIRFDIPQDREVKSIRFIPMEHACLVEELKVVVRKKDEQLVEIFPNWTSGTELDEGNIVLSDAPQEINIVLDGTEKDVMITCKCSLLFSGIMHAIEACTFTVQKRNRIIEELKETSRRQLEEFTNEKNDLRQKLGVIVEEKNELQQKLDVTVDELQRVKNTKWYKMIFKLYRFGSKIRLRERKG